MRVLAICIYIYIYMYVTVRNQVVHPYIPKSWFSGGDQIEFGWVLWSCFGQSRPGPSLLRLSSEQPRLARTCSPRLGPPALAPGFSCSASPGSAGATTLQSFLPPNAKHPKHSQNGSHVKVYDLWISLHRDQYFLLTLRW